MEREFDYIVVGAGTAGCVLANRLSADPSTTVLLLEYGGPGLHPLLYVPKGFYRTIGDPRYTGRYPTRPFGPDGHAEPWLRGRVIGGSSAINGMMYNRGWAADYDALVERGNPGWGWAEILPAFRSIEDHQLGASEVRGAGGPLHVSVADAYEEVTDAIIESAGRLGRRRVPDVNDGDRERIGFTPSTIKNGLRVSAARAFLGPVRKRPNLTVVDRTLVGHLLLDGRRVVGVRTRRNGTTRDFRARREVVVSAGAVETPMLLERSGIGSAEVLARAGVELRVESPNVGERVIEHRGVAMRARLRGNLGHNRLLNTGLRRLRSGAAYLARRRGPIATGAYELASFVKSSPEAARPDIQGLWAPLAIDAHAEGLTLARHAGLMFLGYPLRPTTTSTVHISGPLPGAAPVIEARFLRTDEDRGVASKILDRAREMLSTGPLEDIVLDEEAPGPGVRHPDEVLRYALQTGGGIYHAVGSCAMGPDDDDVLDSALRVRGVEGVRVVDASIFPAMPSGNTAAPVMAAAWRASDLILGER